MEIEPENPHLSRITTEWEVVFQAHNGPLPKNVTAAQAALMARYSGAVHRYLLRGLRDPEAATELDQEFAVRFLRGDFHRANPARGRFRDFVRRALRNLMIDYRRRQQTRPRPLGDALPDLPGPAEDLDAQFDRDFLASWRRELLARAWSGLHRHQERAGQPLYTVLRLRTEHPDLRSPELAERLAPLLDRPVTAGWVRQNLHLARDRFAALLLDEVAASLDPPSPERLEEELIELGLHEYCRPILRRRAAP